MSVSPIDAVIASNLDQLRKPGVLGVRAGYKTVGGWPTRKPAIVVTVEHKADAVPTAVRLPEKVDGYSVDVREASPLKHFELTSPGSYEAELPSIPPEQRVAPFTDEVRLQPIAEEPELVAVAAAAKPQLDYSGPEGVDLSPVEDEFTITCHSSPDAGWPILSAFLAGTTDRLTVGLYDFTSGHILDAVNAALNGKKLDLVLDHPGKNPTADQTDDETQSSLSGQLGENLRFAWALEGSDPFAAVAIFPNAYHIKVAVRDGDTVWLSSGNWNNSNQPDIDPVNKPADAAAAAKADRDWHVVIQHPGLAQTFAAYIENDLSLAAAHQVAGAPEADLPAALPEEMFLATAELETRAFAQFFAPQVFTDHMRIRPLLTPDPGVYVGAVLDLVNGAQRSLYIQTQYAHPSTRSEDQAFTDILNAVVARQQAGVDVRMIFSQWETAPYLEKLQAAGLDLSQVRIQRGVHNKGIVQDGKIVLISSQNWSADGVLRNRDAGVIIEHEPIAGYFQQIFMHDWTNVARQQALDG